MFLHSPKCLFLPHTESCGLSIRFLAFLSQRQVQNSAERTVSDMRCSTEFPDEVSWVCTAQQFRICILTKCSEWDTWASNQQCNSNVFTWSQLHVWDWFMWALSLLSFVLQRSELSSFSKTINLFLESKCIEIFI